MSVSIEDICLTRNDYEKLVRLLGSVSGKVMHYNDGAHLAKELKKAKKVDPRKIPPEVVTMNTTFTLTDLGTGSSKTYTLVYPDSEDLKKSKISVLSYEGFSALGCKIGNVICWKTDSGDKYFQISKILYQPASNGLFDT